MSYETISVRMNRSDSSIRWGFNLSQSGPDVVISVVEKDSLSEKAGLRPGDIVLSACGQKTSDVSAANRAVSSSPFEVYFSLKRLVTSHTCLPWTLTEKDNKLVVDEVRPGFGSGFANAPALSQSRVDSKTFTSGQNQSQFPSSQPFGTSYNTSQFGTNQLGSDQSNFNAALHSPGARSIPIQRSPNTGSTHLSRSDGLSTQRDNWMNPPGRVFHSPSSYATSMKNNNYMRDRQTDQRTNEANIETAKNYSFNNGATTTPYVGRGSGGLPLNQATFIQTSPVPIGGSSAVSPGGSKLLYHSPSPRSRTQLSPGASVHHLQYNSPMNLYSSESAAEQFAQQTGQPAPAQLSSKTPAYLTSETKKLIEENEFGRGHRGPSPSTQSSSFKRISQAVGASAP